MESLKGIGAVIALVIATASATFLYWNHINRAAGQGDLCRRVEQHVVTLGSDENGALREDASGLVSSIGDRCDSFFSKAQADCVLRATSLPEVRACR